MTVQKPNIVLIMCDQMSASAVGSYGAMPALTPNIDRLAREGVRFSNFYCNSPICCASRASMFSGMYVSDVGVYDNGAEFPAATPTLLHGLKSAGYSTYLSGKAHFVGPDQLHGFDERLTPEIYPPTFAWTPNWKERVGLNEGSNVQQLKDAGRCLWSLQLDYDVNVLHRGLERLREEARLQESQSDPAPFFLNISLTHPHDPFFIHEEYLSRLTEESAGLPRENWGEAAHHPYNTWINRHHGLDQFEIAEEQVRRARHAYFAMCSFVDDCVGSVVNEIERLGLTENTMVIFASDHGEMMGEHGMWFKRTFYDEAVRVPFIVKWPNNARTGSVVDSIHSLVDLFPTLCEAGKVSDSFLGNCQLRGRSLLKTLVSAEEGRANRAVIEYLGEGTTEPLRVVVEDRLKLVSIRGMQPLLFDMQSDPFETVNCIADPDYERRASRLWETLLDHWNPDQVKDAILESQTRRRIINEAAYHRNPPRWGWASSEFHEGSVVKQNAQAESEAKRIPPLSQ